MPACVLLTAGPAAGKTCLMSQLVMHTLRRHEGNDANEEALVPIVIKMHDLNVHLLSTNEKSKQSQLL